MSKTYKLDPREFAAVSALPGPARFKYFVGRVADWATVWGLKDANGWVAAADDDGKPAFPVWPHPDFAAACATGDWSGNTPAPIEVHAFVETWLPNLADDGSVVAVFPTGRMSGACVAALELQAVLRTELARLE
jgi:hypothetical protein